MFDHIFLYLRAARMRQRLVNTWPLFVAFLTVFVGHPDGGNVIKFVALFGIFQLLYVGIYLLNEIIDYETDRHTRRRYVRLIASGTVSRQQATSRAVTCIIVAHALAYALIPGLLYWCVVFTLYNLLYTLVLKRIALIYPYIGGVTFAMRFVMVISIFGYVMSDLMWAMVIMIYILITIGNLIKRYELRHENQAHTDLFTLQNTQLLIILTIAIQGWGLYMCDMPWYVVLGATLIPTAGFLYWRYGPRTHIYQSIMRTVQGL